VTSIPGPTKVTAPIAHPTIAWLKKHEPRGRPLPQIRFSHFAFGRVIQPDSDDPVRIGIAVGGKGALCDYYFAPLEPRTYGSGCGGWFTSGPIRLGSWYESPIQHFNGRLAGYNAKDQVAGIVELHGNAVATPCPVPSFAKPVSALPSPRPWERIDLATLSVNGQHILGLTPQEVEAALGKPTTTRSNAQIPELRYGGSLPSTYGLSVGFSKKGDRLFANSLSFRSPALVDAKLGHILRLPPAELERAIVRAYGARLRVFVSYGSNPSLFSACTAVLKERGAPSGISFGLDPYRPSRPFLDIRANAYGG
jgi:hypothetical protein